MNMLKKYNINKKDVKEIIVNAKKPVDSKKELCYADFIAKIQKLNFGHLMAMFKHIEKKIEFILDQKYVHKETGIRIDYKDISKELNALQVQKTLICREMSRRMKEKYKSNEEEKTF